MTTKGIKKKINNFLKNPWLGGISLFITVISFLLSILFYINSKPIRQIGFWVNPSKALIFNSAEASELGVNYRDKKLANDITAIQCYVWNRGNLPIEKNDIKESFSIFPNIHIPILSATIRYKTRQTLNLKIDNKFPFGSIPIEWDILDKDEGFILQVIYSGSPKIDFYLMGSIKGNKNGVWNYNGGSRQLKSAIIAQLFAWLLSIFVIILFWKIPEKHPYLFRAFFSAPFLYASYLLILYISEFIRDFGFLFFESFSKSPF